MKRKFLAWLMTLAMMVNMVVPYAAYADELPVGDDTYVSADGTDLNNDDDATEDVEGEPTVGEPSTDDEPAVGEPSDEEPAVDPVDGNENNAESDGKEGESADEPQGDTPVVGDVPQVGTFATPQGGVAAVADAETATSYLSKLEFKFGSGSLTEITADGDGEYNVAVPSNVNSVEIRVTVVKDAVPEGYEVRAKYKNTDDEDKNIKVSMIGTSNISKNSSLSKVIAQSMTGNTVTVTIGTEGNLQSFTLNITRTPGVTLSAITDADGTALEVDNGKYILLDTKNSFKITAISGCDLYINGEKKTDGEAVEITPVWSADKTYTVKLQAKSGEFSSEELSVTVKQMAADACGDNAKWSYDDTTKTLSITGTGAMKDYASGKTPWNAYMSEIKTVDVGEGITAVGTYAFYKATALEKVTLPTTLKSIGQGAFNGASALKSITLPNGLETIGQSAFQSSGLTSVSIPTSVTTVGTQAFMSCTQLASATVTNAMGQKMFYKCSTLSNVTFAGTTLTAVPTYVFDECSSLKTLALSEGVKTFANQKAGWSETFALTSVSLPASYEGTDFSVFGSKLESITIADGNTKMTQDGSLIYGLTDGVKTSVIKCNKTAAGEITVADGVKSISASAFSGCGEITKVVLPDGLESIGASAFDYCNKLESLNLPKTVKTLNRRLLYFTAVKHIEIPEGITTLPNSIFSNAQSLETVVLPKSLNKFEKRSFYGNKALKAIYFGGGIQDWQTMITNWQQIAYTEDKTMFDDVDIYYHNGRTDVAAVATQPIDRMFAVNDNSDKGLSVSITKPEGATVAMQWYVNDTKTTTGATQVTTTLSDDGLTAYCSPDTSTIADKYYYCVITTKLADGDVDNMTRYAKVVVEKKRWNGEGTANTPFEISTYAELQSLSEYVNSGRDTKNKYFKLTADIEVAADWTPIGTEIGTDTKDYTDTYCFAGVLDGNNHKITYDKGAKSLFKYVCTVTVKDLDIKGEWIDGNGLAEGYITQKNNDEVNITNCRLLSSTSTKGSGFIGRTAGATFTNCEVQENVKIGVNADGTSAEVSKIGSIVGTGSYTIVNCKSAATVYGTDYVGGFCGYNGYAMRGNIVRNCTFTGKVIADGEYVGGILGGGYDSYTAPNSIGAQIINCCVMADITGSRAVGGILGGEGGVDQAWDNANQKILNNLFYGGLTIVSKEFAAWDKDSVHSCPAANVDGSKGGIIGFQRSLNKYNIIENNYFYDKNDENTKGIGAVEHIDTSAVATMGMGTDGIYYYNTSRDKLSDIKEFVDGEDKTVRPGDWTTYTSVSKTGLNRTDDPMGKDADKLAKAMSAEEMKTDATVALLNGGNNSLKNWIKGDNCPVISDTAVAYQLEISGNYKTEYYVGDTLDMSGAKFTATWTDGTTTYPELKDVTITGFDSSKRAVLTLTATYGAASTTFNVKVLLKGGSEGGNSGSSGSSTIKVYFTLLGDYHHEYEDDPTLIHTYKKGNLQTWLAKEAYTVDLNATVADLLEEVEKKHDNVSFSNPKGNWVDAVTFGDLTMTQLDNTDNSGWQYNVNKKHTELLISEYFLNNGDSVIFYWTDDYTQDMGSEGYDNSGNQLGGGSSVKDETKTEEKTDEKTPEATTGSDLPFADVKAGAWYYDAIKAMYEKGLMNGEGEKEFAPNNKLSRAMLVTILYRLAEQPEVNADALFDDVAADQWYTKAVAWANANKIVSGVGDGKFAPNDSITRQELAAMLYRYASAVGLNTTATANLSSFSDSKSVATWAETAMQWAVGSGLIKGDENGTLNPTGTATRAEVATVIVRLLEMSVR